MTAWLARLSAPRHCALLRVPSCPCGGSKLYSARAPFLALVSVHFPPQALPGGAGSRPKCAATTLEPAHPCHEYAFPSCKALVSALIVVLQHVLAVTDLGSCSTEVVWLWFLRIGAER